MVTSHAPLRDASLAEMGCSLSACMIDGVWRWWSPDELALSLSQSKTRTLMKDTVSQSEVLH